MTNQQTISSDVSILNGEPAAAPNQGTNDGRVAPLDGSPSAFKASGNSDLGAMQLAAGADPAHPFGLNNSGSKNCGRTW